MPVLGTGIGVRIDAGDDRGGRSSGDGSQSTIASSNGSMPLRLNAEPASTGTPAPARVARRKAARSSSASIARSSR
ncbi:hypothetical protein NG831_15680 [Xanthomonas sacchari]|nr:hypothetical protein NG831_15680 [Xanthomonas sacchari]